MENIYTATKKALEQLMEGLLAHDPERLKSAVSSWDKVLEFDPKNPAALIGIELTRRQILQIEGMQLGMFESPKNPASQTATPLNPRQESPRSSPPPFWELAPKTEAQPSIPPLSFESNAVDPGATVPFAHDQEPFLSESQLRNAKTKPLPHGQGLGFPAIKIAESTKSEPPPEGAAFSFSMAAPKPDAAKLFQEVKELPRRVEENPSRPRIIPANQVEPITSGNNLLQELGSDTLSFEQKLRESLKRKLEIESCFGEPAPGTPAGLGQPPLAESDFLSKELGEDPLFSGGIENVTIPQDNRLGRPIQDDLLARSDIELDLFDQKISQSMKQERTKKNNEPAAESHTTDPVGMGADIDIFGQEFRAAEPSQQPAREELPPMRPNRPGTSMKSEPSKNSPIKPPSPIKKTLPPGSSAKSKGSPTPIRAALDSSPFQDGVDRYQVIEDKLKAYHQDMQSITNRKKWRLWISLLCLALAIYFLFHFHLIKKEYFSWALQRVGQVVSQIGHKIHKGDPTPAGNVPTPSLEEKIRLAKALYAQKKYTSPKDDNAYRLCQDVLAKDPNNPEALRLLRDIKEIYQKMGDQEYNAGNLEKALSIYKKTLEFFPRDENLNKRVRELTTK
jgi:tetratricopeptide (TPR) repeat protein